MGNQHSLANNQLFMQQNTDITTHLNNNRRIIDILTSIVLAEHHSTTSHEQSQQNITTLLNNNRRIIETLALITVAEHRLLSQRQTFIQEISQSFQTEQDNNGYFSSFPRADTPINRVRRYPTRTPSNSSNLNNRNNTSIPNNDTANNTANDTANDTANNTANNIFHDFEIELYNLDTTVHNPILSNTSQHSNTQPNTSENNDTLSDTSEESESAPIAPVAAPVQHSNIEFYFDTFVIDGNEHRRIPRTNISQRQQRNAEQLAQILTNLFMTQRGIPEMSTNVPLSMREIESAIEIITFNSNDTHYTQCPITLCDFTEGQEVARIKNCQHCFTIDAINRHLVTHRECPMCRREVYPVTSIT